METLPTILVADSDATSYFITRKNFEACNAHVRWIHCTSARETLSSIDELKPDLLIIEPFMPDMDACKFLAALDRNGIFSRYSACLLSLLTEKELSVVAAPYALFGAWCKPITETSVRAILEEVCTCQ